MFELKILMCVSSSVIHIFVSENLISNSIKYKKCEKYMYLREKKNAPEGITV